LGSPPDGVPIVRALKEKSQGTDRRDYVESPVNYRLNKTSHNANKLAHFIF